HLPGKAIGRHLDYREFAVGRSVPEEPLRDLSKDDPAMDRYLRLPPEARSNDLELGGGAEWYSEYTANGKPVPFSCGFIIHLQELGPEQTRVEVLEVDPRIRFGETFVVGHGEAGFVPDSKLVPPTTRDRVEMLERIQTLS